MKQPLRIFVSSPGDVKAAREIAALTIERLAQDYARFFKIEPYLWESEAMVASGHFQDSIEPPSAFDVVVLIVWSTLGTSLPERTGVREYRGIDGRAPVTGTEWEFEESLQAAQKSGAPDLLVYRSQKPAPFDTRDPGRFEQQSQQLKALNGFWERHFANQGLFIGAYTSFTSDTEFAAALEGHLRKLIERRIAALRAAQADTVTKAWAQAPFRGLEAYEFEHAPIFFGQDEALSKAMLQLTGNAEAGSPFLLVLGASGSGKSSLVKAGVVPKLFVPRRIAGTAFLRRVVFRPSDARDGEDLFDALARRLTTQLSDKEGVSELIGHGQSPGSLAAHLRNATAAPTYPIESALGHLTAQARQLGRMLEYETARLILVVDQLEELFTTDRIPPGERTRFIELLAGLVRSGLVWVVATMRSDFWHRAAATPELIRLSEGNGRLDLLPPGAAQLSHIIRRPAEAAGVTFELHGTSNVALNEVISEEVAREPGVLPLLSYLLDQLYRNDVLEAHGNTLTYATYEGLGRLEGAIATKAETVLGRCVPEDRQALGSVLFSLVQLGNGEGDVERAIARRVPLSTFPPGTPQRRLVDALLDPDARLLVSDAEKDGSPTVRVAHEALIARWAQAREFVQSHAEALKIRRRIEERYALWRGLEVGGEPTAHLDSSASEPLAGRFSARRSRFGREEGLLFDIDLTDARRLLKEHRSDTEPHLVAYIERSIADDKRIRTRSFRVLSAVASVVALLAIAATVAAWVASKKQREAEYQTVMARQAQMRSLTEAAASRLKEGELSYARAIILEVLKNADPSKLPDPAAVNVFQEVRAGDPLSAILAGHQGRVTGRPGAVRNVAYSPDGTRIVTASLDGTARIWDARTGTQLSILRREPKSVVMHATYSRDGTRIITSAGGIIKIWDAQSGALVRALTDAAGKLGSAVFSPDGRRVATSLNKTARVWDARTGDPLITFPDQGREVYFTAYSPDGAEILTLQADNTARILDARSGRQLAVLSGHTADISDAAYSPDGSRVVTGSSDGTARIWNARSGALLFMLSMDVGQVWGVAFSPDGKTIATGTTDKKVRIWDAATGTQLREFSGHAEIVGGVAYSPDSSHLVSAGYDGTARIWDLRTGPNSLILAHSGEVSSIGYSPDGTRIVTASDKLAHLWDAHSGAELAVLSGHTEGVSSVEYSHDGTKVLTGSDDQTARIWDARSGVSLKVLSGPDGVLCASFSLDDSRIVASFANLTVGIWDAHTGALIVNKPAHGDYIGAIGYSPDGQRILTASVDTTARTWDSNLGGQLTVLQHVDYVNSARYSPDGKRIVTGTNDAAVRIWDADSGRQIITMLGHQGGVFRAAFSPDGSRVVSASKDRTIRIWDARTGTQLAMLPGHTNMVWAVVYSPDSTHITSASRDQTARIWDAQLPGDLRHQILWARAAESDPLTELQLRQLGLPPAAHLAMFSESASACDREAGAFYDPERRAPGLEVTSINADTATRACGSRVSGSTAPPRTVYEAGRALAAKGEVNGAVRDFELALSQGYAAAGIDLARQLTQENVHGLDPTRAVSLYEQAWRRGLSIAAFALGQLYERGLPAPATTGGRTFPADPTKAWLWYRRGADAHEPNALARFAWRDEQRVVSENPGQTRNDVLLEAFKLYAEAAARAQEQDWPDEVWRTWRYRRATLARVLARDGLMQQVADAYAAETYVGPTVGGGNLFTQFLRTFRTGNAWTLHESD